MYRELVEKYAKDYQWVQIGPPCPERMIRKAEKEVGYAFPEELVELLREMDGDRLLLLSAKEIAENVRRNRKFAAPYYESREEYEEQVDRHIFFATNGCGDYFCYKILPDGRGDGSRIYLWEHETNACTPAARNMADLIIGYYKNEI